MFIVGMLSWWYGAGWKARLLMVRERLERSIDYFSINILAKTLFAPYRQISAGKVQGSLGLQWRSFVDQTISRLVGSVVRTIIIIIGSFAILFQVVSGCILLLFWALIPLFPLIGFILFISGWVPITWK